MIPSAVVPSLKRPGPTLYTAYVSSLFPPLIPSNLKQPLTIHQLYYTVDNYHQQVLSNGQKFGFDGERNDAHASHCFEYLRNQLMCMMDMTLEGSESLLDATGMGQPHMCRNRDEAVAWIEERRADDIRSIVGP